METIKKIFCLIAIQLAVFAIFGIVWHVCSTRTVYRTSFACRFNILGR